MARWSWWQRPLTFGVAAAAVLAAFVALRVLTPPDGARSRELSAELVGGGSAPGR